MISSILLAIVIVPWVIIPLIPLAALFLYIRKYFVASSVEMKRIEGISNLVIAPPVFYFINLKTLPKQAEVECLSI